MNVRSASAVSSGTSPLMTTTVVPATRCSRAAATASPVPQRLLLHDADHALGEVVAQPPRRVVDDDDEPGAGLARGGDGPGDQRAPAQRVEHLGERRAHPGSLAGGEDDDGGSGHVAHRSIGAVGTGRRRWGVV
jgi:hypothetical protein